MKRRKGSQFSQVFSVPGRPELGPGLTLAVSSTDWSASIPRNRTLKRIVARLKEESRGKRIARVLVNWSNVLEHRDNPEGERVVRDAIALAFPGVEIRPFG